MDASEQFQPQQHQQQQQPQQQEPQISQIPQISQLPQQQQQPQQQQLSIEPAKPEPVRSAPNSACVSCRKLKMKCERTGDFGAPCIRCAKSGRACEDAVPTPRQRRRGLDSPSRFAQVPVRSPIVQLPLPDTYPPPNQYASPYPQWMAVTAQMTADTTPSVSTNLQRHSYVPGASIDVDMTSSLAISREDTIELVELFRDRLLPNLPVLSVSDFKDASSTVDRYPDLTSCICYVSARYVPGYEDVRKGLKLSVERIIQSRLTECKDRGTHDGKEDLSAMQAFMILYAFSRATLFDVTDIDDVDISFFFIKTVAEAYASIVQLDKAVYEVQREAQNGQRLTSADLSVKKYLYWLWLSNMSHQVALVLSKRPTMDIELNKVVAPDLLKDSLHDTAILSVVRDVELCLIWDKLGSMDTGLKEWWMPREWYERITGRYQRLGREDVENVLEECKSKLGVSDVGSTGPAFLSAFNFDYARFCALTHVLHLGGELQHDQFQALDRCILAAMHVLDHPSNFGLARRDQLKFLPSLFFVKLNHCCLFVQAAVHTYSGMYPDSSVQLTAVKRTINLLMDFGFSGKQNLDTVARIFAFGDSK